MPPLCPFRRPCLALIAGTAVMLAATPALAGPAQPATTWADPTRPAGAETSGAAPAAPRAARAASAPAVAAAAPQLQSVQLGSNGQASALVSGRLVQPGDTLGASRIVAIDADGLTLRDAKGRTERLTLISAAIAKQAGGTERPVAASPGSGQAATAGPAATTTAAVRREGQRQ